MEGSSISFILSWCLSFDKMRTKERRKQEKRQNYVEQDREKNGGTLYEGFLEFSDLKCLKVVIQLFS